MKTKRIIGHVMMIIGMMIPLYMAGSLSLSILTRADRYDRYVEQTAEISPEEWDEIEKRSIAYNERLKGDNQAVDPFEVEEYKVDYQVLRDPDGIYAYISIPRIDITAPVLLGASRENLLYNFAHVDGTDLPIGGPGTRSVIAAHRGGYEGRQDLLFAHDIREGDILRIDLGNRILEYRMVNRQIIDPSEWEKLKPVEGKDLVTLLTCDPIFIYNNRMLIDFERVNPGPVVEAHKPTVDSGQIRISESEETVQSEETVTDTGMSREDLKKRREDFMKEEEGSFHLQKYLVYGVTLVCSLILILFVIRLIRTLKERD